MPSELRISTITGLARRLWQERFIALLRLMSFSLGSLGTVVRNY